MNSVRMIAIAFLVTTGTGVPAQQPDATDAIINDILNDDRWKHLETLRQRTQEIRRRGDAKEAADLLKLLTDERSRVERDQAKVEEVRRTPRPGVQPPERRAATYTGERWQADQDHQNRIDEIMREAEIKYRKRYGKELLFPSPELGEWRTTDEGRTFDYEIRQAQEDHRRKLRELEDRARHGNAPGETAREKAQQQVADELDFLSNAAEQAIEIIDRNRGGPPRPPRDLIPSRLSDSSRPGSSLSFEAIREGTPGLPVRVGEPVRVKLRVRGGRPPYMATYVTSGGESNWEGLNIGGSGERWFTFQFRSPGQHSIRFAVWDAVEVRGAYRGPSSGSALAEAIVDVRVIQADSSSAQQPPQPPPVQPAIPQTNQSNVTPTPPPPLLQPFSGTYKAHLWCMGIPYPAENGATQERHTPLSLTIDPSGTVNGRCNYTAPASRFNSKFRSENFAYEWKTQFTIQGRIDWQTGKIELNIPDGQISWYQDSHLKAGALQLTNRSEGKQSYSATLTGRHTSDAALAGSMNQLAARAPRGQDGLPRATARSQIIDGGWCGLPGMDAGVFNTRVQVSSNVIKSETKGQYAPPPTTSNNAALVQQSIDTARARGQDLWYLKLVGLDTTPQDLAKADLVGTSIWPKRKEKAKVGETVNVTFVGVFGSNYSQVRDLTNIADWQVPPGLQQVQPGVFKATRPGEYTVRARAKGKDGKWMEGYVTINATGS